jgi:hypothetical protein
MLLVLGLGQTLDALPMGGVDLLESAVKKKVSCSCIFFHNAVEEEKL